MPRPRRRAAKSYSNETHSGSTKHTVADCLFEVGVRPEHFVGCESLDDEFRSVKMVYFAAILENHPDKGGDAATFRKIRTAFEVLRELKTNGSVKSFTTHLQQSTNEYYDSVFDNFASDKPTPSYDHFYHAAQEEVPGYRVECARSSRSQCVACKNRKNRPPRRKKARTDNETREESNKSSVNNHLSSDHSAIVLASSLRALGSTSFIPKDAIRIGSLDETSGTYGRWYHLECWRVPYRIWAGLTEPENHKQVLQDLLCMEEVLLSNLHALSTPEQTAFVTHIMDKTHWARKTAASKAPPELRQANAPKSSMSKSPLASDIVWSAESLNAAESTDGGDPSSSAIILKTLSREYFVVPQPGVNGAIANIWENKKFVLTGIFPEVGGGKGLNLGKDRVRAMIESFGGSVTSSISGRTSFLVVGKEPGQSKVSNAKSRGIPLINLMHLQAHVLGQVKALEEAAPPPVITSFSAGYQGAYLSNR